EYQFFNTSDIILKIDPGGKGPHTVSQHIDRNSLKMFFNPTGHLMKIFYNPLIPSSIKISQVLFSFNTFSMTSVVVDHCCISMLSQIFHKRQITLFVFTHSMRYLKNTLYFPFRFCIQQGKPQSVKPGPDPFSMLLHIFHLDSVLTVCPSLLF